MLNNGSTELWFVATRNERWGPVSDKVVQQHVDACRLDSTSKVWRRGLADWEPISNHFAFPASDTLLFDNTISADLSTRDGGNSAKFTKKGWYGWAALLPIALSSVLYAFLFGGLNYTQFGRFAGAVHAATWIVAASLVFASSLLIWQPWSRRRQRSQHGVQKAITATAALAAIGLSITFGGATPIVARIGDARSSFAGYHLEYEPSTLTLTFSGTVGPGVAAKISHALNTHSGVTTLRLNSPGGLLDEALRAAQALGRWPDVKTQIDGECNSACVIIFVGGSRREADIDASIGLHAASAITRIPSIAASQLEREAQAARDFMVRQGIPARLLAEAEALPQGKLKSLDALELLDLGVVDAVTIDGSPLEERRARWLWIAHRLRQSSLDLGFSDVALELHRSQDSSILASSKEIYLSVRSGDEGATKSATLNFMNSLRPRLLESGDPDVVVDYLDRSMSVTDYLVSMEMWGECGALADGKGLSGVNLVPGSVAGAELEGLAAALRSAEQAQWVSRPIPAWAKPESERLIQAAVEDVSHLGGDLLAGEWDNRTKCLFGHSLSRRVLKLEPVKAVAVWRWLLSQS